MPQRIVSINLCTDQLVLALEPGGRLAAVSQLARDRALSAAWWRALKVPVTPASLEHVLSFKPDLVLAGAFGHARLVAHLERAGVRVVRVRDAADFEDIRQAYLAVGRAVGMPARAQALVAQMDAVLAAAAPAGGGGVPARVRAAILSPGLLAHGDGMLGGAVLARAGYANALSGGGYVSLERLAANPPAQIFVAAGQRAAPSRAVRLLNHRVFSRLAVQRVPPAPLICGSLATARLVRELAAQRALEQAGGGAPGREG